MDETRPQTRSSWRQRRYGITLSGFLYVGTTVFIAIGALNSQNNLLFLAFGLAVGGLIVSGVVSGSALMSLSVEQVRLLPARAGEETGALVKVRNRSRWWPAFGVRVRLGVGETREHEQAADVQAPEGFAPCVPGSASVSVRLRGHAEERGVVRYRSVRVSSTFPFGLFVKSIEKPIEELGVVRPGAAEPDRHALARLRRSGWTGQGQSRRPGQGEEYYGLREYIPGDPARMIARRASARAGTWLVRQHSAPVRRRVWLVVEPADPERLEPVLRTAAATLGELVRLGWECGLVLGPVAHRPSGAPAAVAGMLDALGRVRSGVLEEPRVHASRGDHVLRLGPSGSSVTRAQHPTHARGAHR